MRMLQKRNIAAVTLVELLIVVALISVAVGMAVTQFSPDQQSTAAQAARLIATQLDYVRELAVSNNTQYRVSFDKTGNRLLLSHIGTDNSLDDLPDSGFWTDVPNTSQQALEFSALPVAFAITLEGAVDASTTSMEYTEVDFIELGGTSASDDVQVWIRAGDLPHTFAPITILMGTGLVELGDLTNSLPSVLAF